MSGRREFVACVLAIAVTLAVLAVGPAGRGIVCVGWSVATVVCLIIAIAAVRRSRTSRLRTAGSPRTYARVARGEGLPLDELARRLGTTADELRRFEPVYREAQIPKRRGGTRRLLIPSDETKAAQRRILRRVLVGLRAHPAATGFEHGKSIVDNALPHAGRTVVVKMDVVDFFPSTKAERVLRCFQWVGWSREAAEVLTKLTTAEGGLPQGAPTSPRLSNLVNRYLDVQIESSVGAHGGVYTRYADDITISYGYDSGRRARGAVQAVRRILRHHGYRLHTHRKLHVARSHQRQVVTGLVVNDGVRLPREVRRRLRATRHRMAKGLPPLQGEAAAQGWFAFERMVARQAARGQGDAT